MNRLTIALSLITLSWATPGLADSDYEAARKDAHRAYVNSDEGRSWQIIDLLLNDRGMSHNQCKLLAESAENLGPVTELLTCFTGDLVKIRGISENGRALLIESIESYETHRLNILDERTRRHVELCESDVSDPRVLAAWKSEIHHFEFQQDLEFYNAAIDRLEPSDLAVVEKQNVDAFSLERPVTGQYRRKLAIQLANEYPDEYVAAHQKNCSVILTDKGIPFRKYRRNLLREDCVRTIASAGPDGSVESRVDFSMDEGCVTFEYYAQQPRLPVDEIVVGNPVADPKSLRRSRDYPRHTWIDCDGNVHQSNERPQDHPEPCRSVGSTGR